MKQQKIALKTLAMKARVANFIRKELYKEKLENISKDEKIAFFDKVFEMNLTMHNDLRAYKWKREWKADIEKEREKRGYKRKKRTTKQEYENSKTQNREVA